MLNKTRLFLISVTVLILCAIVTTGWTQKKMLTYQQVYRRGEPKLLGSLPRIQGWLDDQHYLELKSDKEDKTKTQLMKVNAATGEESIFLDYQALNEKLPKGFTMQRSAARTKDFTGFVFNQKNDLYYFSIRTEEFKRLTATASPENNPKFSPDGKLIAYTREHNLYVIEVATGLEHQLTNDGSDVVYNGWASWVYYEEILGRSSRYAAFWWAPNSEMIAFMRFDDSPVPEFPIFRADGVHGELEIEHYPKPGDANPMVRLGVVHLETGKIDWVDVDEHADHYVAWPFWTPDSKQLFFQWMNRGQDHIKIYSADPLTGEKTEIYDETQISWVDFFTDLYFFKDGSGFLLRTDKDGWSHLYLHDLTGHLKRRLTKGAWRVSNIELVDEKNKTIYFRHTLNNATETHLSRVSFDGKNLKRLTNIAGNHRCMISPAGSYFIDTYSNIKQPTKMDLVSTDGKFIRTLGDQKLALLDEYDLGKVELFTIPSGDGYDLPAIWTLPPNLDKTQKYPVIFQIYSGPGATTVTNSFTRLSNHFMAQNGIIIISVDHRGSNHFGKKGRALMHRNLGKWEMHDLIAAVKWLRELPFIDPERIGITGGSYGGYTTCMAMTYGADYFTHGIAQYSVTDWKLYDTVYTERYMDTPAENPEGYEFGSVMTHLDKYKGPMLITHGTMDDNVHMQNTIQLIDKLEDMEKDFELMLYPNERHGVRFPKRNHAVKENVQFWFRHFLHKELSLDNTPTNNKS
ncbi:MAG: S9 family peptidase [bacterium]